MVDRPEAVVGDFQLQSVSEDFSILQYCTRGFIVC
jgi:hypothetical protein